MSRNIILGVCGSIAAPKAQSICLALQHQSFDVRIAMSFSATQIISPTALSAVCPNPVLHTLWAQQRESGSEIHINWSRWAQAILIAPATASTLAALAHGFYDSPVTLLAANIPTEKWFIAPAMSEEMWNQQAVKQNVATLSAWGVTFLGPSRGVVASGAYGQRMLEPRELAVALAQSLATE